MLRSWLALGLGVMVAAVTLAAGYQLVASPATYRQAVTEVLAQHQVAYTDLDIREICLPDPSCIIRDSTPTYQAVTVYRDSVSYGQITCYDQGGDCYLDLVALGIRRAPLRDLRGVRMLPKPLVQVAEHILAHMRAMVRRSQPTTLRLRSPSMLAFTFVGMPYRE
jgi:hypothetical protein